MYFLTAEVSKSFVSLKITNNLDFAFASIKRWHIIELLGSISYKNCYFSSRENSLIRIRCQETFKLEIMKLWHLC